MTNLPLPLYLAVRFAIYLAIGALLGMAGLVWILWVSEGTEPKDLCVFVPGKPGPFSLVREHDRVCDFDFGAAAIYVGVAAPILAVPGALLSAVAIRVWRIAMARRDRHRDEHTP